MKVSETWKVYQANKGLNLYSRAVMVALGVVMIVVGLMTLTKMIMDMGGHVDFNAYPILIVSGGLVILLSNKPASNAVLITGISLALCIFVRMLYTINDRPLTYTVPVAAYCFILILCSISYYVGNRHNAWRIMVLVIVHIVNYVANILFVLYMTKSWDNVFDGCLEDIVAIVFCCAFVYFLQQPAVREDSINVLMRTGVGALEAVAISRSTIYITESSLSEMLGQTRSTWIDYEDGPVASEGRSEIVDGKKTFQCTSRIWRDEDFIRVSLNRDGSALTYGSGFEIRSVQYVNEDIGRFVYLYGREGYFVKLMLVSDTEQMMEVDEDDDQDQFFFPESSN